MCFDFIKALIKTLLGRDSDYSSGGVATLNGDVLTEILVPLPAKTVIRLKSVCKKWQSIISSPEFCRLHTLHHRHNKLQPSLLLRTNTPRCVYFHPILNPHKLIPYTFSFTNPKILSSCNGLLLLQCGDDYYVYNPTTRHSRQITLTNRGGDVLGLALAFDPTKSSFYKIVCIKASLECPPHNGTRHCQIEVYDSVSRAWKVCLEEFIVRDRLVDLSRGVHWNNTIYWGNFSRSKLILFDIDKNTKLHTVMKDGSTDRCFLLQESDGHLYFLLHRPATQSVAAYEKREGCPKWSFKFRDGLNGFLESMLSNGGFAVLSFIDGETPTLVYHVPGKISAYRLVDKRFEELVDLTTQQFYESVEELFDWTMPPFYEKCILQFDNRDVYQFAESLAPV